MTIKVTITKVLEDFWGADQVPVGKLEGLCREDIPALLADAEFEFNVVEDEPFCFVCDGEGCRHCNYEKRRTEPTQGCQSSGHGGKCRGELWQCAECGRAVCYAEGSDNDFELCDDCWCKKHAAD